jgi:predicted  nucleic acid-binding Zn-ribbon protein
VGRFGADDSSLDAPAHARGQGAGRRAHGRVQKGNYARAAAGRGPQAASNHFAISAIEVLAQHLDALRGRVEADAVERMRLAESLGARIDSLAGMQEQLGKGIEEVSGRVQAAHDSIRDQANSIWKSLEERDKRASDQARAASDQAAALWKAIEGCSARDKDLWKGIEDANARIGELHQSIQDRSDAIWKGVEGNTARAAQLRQSLDEQAQALWKGIEDANARAADFYKSLEDGASALWKSLAERGDQMQRQLEGIRACHASISALDAALRELRAKFLALNEEVVQLREEGGAVSRAAASEAPMPSAPLACEPQFGGRESTPPSAAAPPEGADAADSLDSLYLRFQRQFRGDEAMCANASAPTSSGWKRASRRRHGREIRAAPPRLILDLACGDGIFIELLRKRRDGTRLESISIARWCALDASAACQSNTAMRLRFSMLSPPPAGTTSEPMHLSNTWKCVIS